MTTTTAETAKAIFVVLEGGSALGGGDGMREGDGDGEDNEVNSVISAYGTLFGP